MTFIIRQSYEKMSHPLTWLRRLREVPNLPAAQRRKALVRVVKGLLRMTGNGLVSAADIYAIALGTGVALGFLVVTLVDLIADPALAIAMLAAGMAASAVVSSAVTVKVVGSRTEGRLRRMIETSTRDNEAELAELLAELKPGALGGAASSAALPLPALPAKKR